MLTDNGMSYDEVVLGKNATTRTVRAMTGKETVPQVFIDGDYIGGSEELEIYIKGAEQAAA
jgi:glutaredoxin